MNTADLYYVTGRIKTPIFVAELYMQDSSGSGFSLGLVRKLNKRQQKMWKKYFGLDYKEFER